VCLLIKNSLPEPIGKGDGLIAGDAGKISLAIIDVSSLLGEGGTTEALKCMPGFEYARQVETGRSQKGRPAMIDRILVAIDGGEASQTLLELGCTLADKHKAKLGILYVTDPQEVSSDLLRAAEIEGVVDAPSYTSAMNRWEYYGSIKMRDKVHRSEAAMRLSAEVGQTIVSDAKAFTKSKDVKAVKTFVRSGDPADGILSVAREANADLIILGHERRSGLQGLIHSSVAKAVDDKADCPCLVLSQ